MRQLIMIALLSAMVQVAGLLIATAEGITFAAKAGLFSLVLGLAVFLAVLAVVLVRRIRRKTVVRIV